MIKAIMRRLCVQFGLVLLYVILYLYAYVIKLALALLPFINLKAHTVLKQLFNVSGLIVTLRLIRLTNRNLYSIISMAVDVIIFVSIITLSLYHFTDVSVVTKDWIYKYLINIKNN